MRSYLLILLFFVSSTYAFADTYPVVTLYWYQSSSQTASTKAAACALAHLSGGHGNWVSSTLTCQLLKDTDNSYMGTLNASVVNTCPYGGTVSGSSCINAPSCSTGQSRDATGQCVAIPITCPSGQYAPSGSTSSAQCTVIPNCNASSPQDGQFFNTSTGQCSTYTGAMTLCITGKPGLPQTNFYCPPIDDCIPATQTCSNNSADVTAAQNARSAQVAAIKLQADARRAQADTAATQAANAVSAKQAEKTAAASAAVAAKAASDSAAASGNSTPSQIAAAADAYNKAAAESAAASAKASNAAAASGVAGTQAGLADSADNSIPSSNPGNAGSYSDRVDGALVQALTALNDALSGLGSGTGTGQGSSAGTCQDTGTCTDGTSPATTSYTGAGRFYTTTGKTVASVSAEFMTKATNSPLLKAGQDIMAVSIPSVSSCASCDLSLPSVMGMPSIFNQPFCAEWMGAFWLFISAALKVATVFMALRIMITPTF